MSLGNKIDFAIIIRVNRANPNGDPLNGNRPRVDYEGFGEISDVCLKRKIRNRLLAEGHSIFVQSDDNKVDGMPSLRERAISDKFGLGKEAFNSKKAKPEETAKEACAKWPGRIAVGIDARDGYVAVEGWAETSEVTALELAQKFEDCGVTAIIFTDIDRDGAMGGPNIESTVALASAISTPVIVSGGVSSLDDLIAVAKHTDAGIDGAISGRALYDGRIDLAEAIRALS